MMFTQRRSNVDVLRDVARVGGACSIPHDGPVDPLSIPFCSLTMAC